MKRYFTRTQLILEIIGILGVLGMIVFVGIRYASLPDLIPGHYNSLGEIDRFGSKNEIFLLPIVTILLYAGITVVSFFPNSWNIPTKVTPQNEGMIYRCVSNLILATKLEMLGMFIIITYYVSYTKPLPAIFTPATLIILFGTILYFIIRLVLIGKRKL